MTRLMCVLLSACVLSGCKVIATMIPVDGPLSRLAPPPTIDVRADGTMGGSGKLSFATHGGSPCKGRWSSTASASVSVGSMSLLSQYGTAYLSGYNVATGSAPNPGQGLATCADGTTFQLEFVTAASSSHGYGIAKDSQQNVYRYVF